MIRLGESREEQRAARGQREKDKKHSTEAIKTGAAPAAIVRRKQWHLGMIHDRVPYLEVIGCEVKAIVWPIVSPSKGCLYRKTVQNVKISANSHTRRISLRFLNLEVARLIIKIRRFITQQLGKEALRSS
jgi:hypothetical protein